MKKLMLLSALVFAINFGFAKELTLDVLLSYYPEAKDKGCTVVVENQRTGVLDTLDYSKNKFKVDLKTNSGIIKVHFIKKGYITKTVVVNTQAKTNNHQVFRMEIAMVGTDLENVTAVVGTLNYVYQRDEFVPISARFN